MLFPKMHLPREVEARISVVMRMHYRETVLLIWEPCHQVFERTWFVVTASVGAAIHDVRRRELVSVARLRI